MQHAVTALIAATSLLLCILYDVGIGRLVDRRTQAWRLTQ